MIEGRVNLRNCDLLCAQLAAYAIKGLEDIHLHHADIGPHIMELRGTFHDIESTAYDVIRGIRRGRCRLATSLALYFTVFVVLGAFIPTFLDITIDSHHDSVDKLLDTLFKAAPFLTPLLWAAFNSLTKKDRILSEGFRTTAAWIRKAAAVVYRILDEDILPAIPPIVPAPGPLPHPRQVPIPQLSPLQMPEPFPPLTLPPIQPRVHSHCRCRPVPPIPQLPPLTLPPLLPPLTLPPEKTWSRAFLFILLACGF